MQKAIKEGNIWVSNENSRDHLDRIVNSDISNVDRADSDFGKFIYILP